MMETSNAQYTYARANSILRKAGVKIYDCQEINEICEDEFMLVAHLNSFHDSLIEAAERNEPFIITKYVSELARLYHRFYNACPVLGSENESFRLALTQAVGATIKAALGLIGIECVYKM